MKSTIRKGDKYNKLTAIRFDHKDKWGQQYWLFKCDCGNKKVIKASNVKGNYVKSCGCLRKENIIRYGKKSKTHGMTHTREYKSWQAMKDRCYNKNYPHYKDYGGRGIKVCNHWRNSFENFYKDMSKRPKNTSLDRIDNNKGYYKKNCHWATTKEQANNRRNNRLLTFNNKTMTIAQWTSKTNLKYAILYTRLKKGWSIEKTLTTLVNNNKNYEN